MTKSKRYSRKQTRKVYRKKSKSQRKTKSKKKYQRRNKPYKPKQNGGDGYFYDLADSIIPGQPARVGYSECCPPAFDNGQVIRTDTGQQYCS